MSSRTFAYLALAALIALSAVVDVVVWPDVPPTPLTWIDVVLLIGIVVFVYWWEVADANERGTQVSPVARILTIVVAFIGHAVYLFGSRNWKRATLVFLVFWGGLAIVYFVALAGAAMFLDIVDPVITYP